MFTLEVDKDLQLALVQPGFAKSYLAILERDREYLSKWLSWPAEAVGDEFFLKFIERSLKDYAEGKSLTCAMLHDGAVVGNVSLNSINHTLKRTEIGYWLCSDQQGKGIVTRSVAKLIDLAFDEFEMRKAQISAATENRPSRRVAERLGFVLEGVITRSENLNGNVVDHAVYGLGHDSWNRT